MLPSNENKDTSLQNESDLPETEEVPLVSNSVADDLPLTKDEQVLTGDIIGTLTKTMLN